MAIDVKEMLQTPGDDTQSVDLSWMENDAERGFWAKPGRRGLTLEETVHREELRLEAPEHARVRQLPPAHPPQEWRRGGRG